MKNLDHFIRFAGMKRHGNHALINWLISQYTGNITFRNNAGKVENLVCTKCDGIEALKTNKIAAVDLEEPCDKTLFLVSYEDFPPGRVFAPDLEPRYQHWVKHDIHRSFNVILLRDPMNYLASRLRGEKNGDFVYDLKFSKGEKDFIALTSMWKTYAKWFLQFEQSSNPNEIAISYNQWLVSRSYRDSLCDRLGIENTNDESRKLVSGWGGGSSFVGTRLQESSAYLNRWKEFADHPLLKRLLQDDEILAQSVRIFGDTIDFPALQSLFTGHAHR